MNRDQLEAALEALKRRDTLVEIIGAIGSPHFRHVTVTADGQAPLKQTSIRISCEDAGTVTTLRQAMQLALEACDATLKQMGVRP